MTPSLSSHYTYFEAPNHWGRWYRYTGNWRPVDFIWGKSAWGWEDHTSRKLQAGQKPLDTIATRQLKLVMKTGAVLRSVMSGLLTRCALAINYCNRIKTAGKYFCHLIGLYVVLFFVLQKALGEDLRLNHISKKELLNGLILFISCIFHTVHIYICMYREREENKTLETSTSHKFIPLGCR